MNSYMRQQATVSAEQMQHSFLKDKQAWENAIALYQGPDPLDHWWNYICWYENHGHGDPDNKFRETLERCLTLYEHSDYYKQDVRMVRLWLKYIDMQSNPLHFYQVLHQRGVGRQLASFYISWASYYESINALKEAEAVYNLAFQEKAQPYAELHHAHSKFIYTKSLNAQQHHVVHYHLQQQQQHVQHIQTAASSHASMHPQTAHNHNQYRQPVPYQHQAQPIGAVAATSPQNQQHTQIHGNHIIQQNQQLYHQTQPSTHYSPHLQQPHQIHQQQLQQQVLAHAQIQQQSMQTPQITMQETLACTATSEATAQNISNPNHLQTQTTLQKHSHVAQQHNSVPVEQQLPAATASMSRQQYERALEASVQRQPLQIADEYPLSCVRLPRKFANYCSNSDETWQPALFLEEPYDPQRFCHYAKSLVYPAGEGVEYSPEEIKARRYIQNKHQQEVEKQNDECVKSAKVEPHKYIHSPQAFMELNHVNNNNNHMLEHNSQEIQLQLEQAPPQSQYSHNSSNYEQHKRLQQIIHKENDDDNEEVERDGQGEEDDVEDEAEEDENNETEEESDKNYHQQSYRADVINTADDLEDQIEASTISFKTEGSQNKTIKIKFKKERPTAGSGDISNAYTIERIYQPEVESPTVPALDASLKRNGHHSFHPYLLGHTSTPKTSAKRQKAKIKRASNKYPIIVSSNSNSSSAENGATIATMTNNVDNSTTIDERKINYDRSIHNATFNDNANYSFSSAVALDNSNCSLSNAVGRLNFRDVSSITNTSLNHQSSVAADISTYQENSYFATQNDAEAKESRLARALETIERHMAKEAIDPFNSELCRAFLTKLDFPGTDGEAHDNYKIIHTPLPKIANTRQLNLPYGIQFHIDKEIGRGSYGSVYKATDVASGSVVALKFQKPANTWEIYICDQVLKRIKSASVLPGLMDISTAIIASNASLIATEFSPYGSLLDINNKIRQATTKVMHESLVMHFSAQICNIIHHLHQNKIIHADIKPDNFLLMRVPSTELHFPSLRLIDFGCAIDMTLFPGGDTIKFRKVIQTDGFTCIEMQEGRSWSYETDLFCIAGTVHVMLFGEYMQLQKRAGSWDIKQKLPRYLKKHVWTQFFGDILNIKANQLPDLNAMRHIFEEETAKMDSELQKQMRTLSNILHRR